MDNTLSQLISDSALPEHLKNELLELAKNGPSLPLTNAIESAFRQAIDAEAAQAGVDLENDPELKAGEEAFEQAVAARSSQLEADLARIQTSAQEMDKQISEDLDALNAENIRSTLP